MEIRTNDLTEQQKDRIKVEAWKCDMSAIEPVDQDDTDVTMYLDLYNRIHKILFQGFGS